MTKGLIFVAELTANVDKSVLDEDNQIRFIAYQSFSQELCG